MASISSSWQSFERFYKATGLQFDVKLFVGGIFILALIAAFLSFGISQYLLPLPFQASAGLVSTILFLSLLVLIIAIPMKIRSGRIDEIETNLPDALKHLSQVLKSGGTVDSALEDVSNADFCALSYDLKKALKQIKEGKSFDDALLAVAYDSSSPLFYRSASIIVDAKNSGAGLADVINDISSDAKDEMRTKRERESRTMMPVSFLIISSLLLSPFIFGFVMSVIDFISKVGNGGSDVTDGLNLILLFFIPIQAIMSTIAIGLIREGKATKYLLYVPIIVLIALFVYLIGRTIGGSFVS